MLMKHLEDRIFKSAAPQAIRHLTRPDLNTTNPTLRAILDQASQEFQTAPPLTIHMADPALLGGLWHVMREVYVVNPSTRAMREAVAGAVSSLNTCPYCVTVHDGMFRAAGGDKPGQSPHVNAARIWAAATLQPAQDLPDIATDDFVQVYGTGFLYHYINRMVSVFLSDSPIALPGMATGPGQKLAKAMFSWMSRRIAQVGTEPGQSVAKASGELPQEFNWARGNPVIAGALAHFATCVEAGGQAALSDEVRQLVLAHLHTWSGEQPPLSRAWVEDVIATVSEADRPAARIALLTARAPWQVDERVIGDFRRTSPGDTGLVQACAWASFTTARRIAGWFAPFDPLAPPERLA